MKTNWILVAILYAWLLAGLLSAKKLKDNEGRNKYLILASFFFGPLGLGWVWLKKLPGKIVGSQK